MLFLFSDFLFITQFDFQIFKVFVTLFILVNKDGAWETEFLSGGDLVRKTSTVVCWQQLEWKETGVWRPNCISRSTICHFCSCCLKYDPWTIRISISITWELIRWGNPRPLLDLLRKNLYFNAVRTSDTHSHL